LIGETLGKYEITEHLGHGGMAEVYKAYQAGLDRYVAIKVLHSFLADEENFLTRFKREAKAVAALRHPNIVQVYDFDYDEERGLYYMVMELVEGLNLKERLQKAIASGEQIPLPEAARIVAAMADALDYAHRRGMVHRDVKPANIMFNEDGEVILTDFGIAKMVDMAGLTASGAMVGTPAYISPEQGMGQAGDDRSDIYSLGVVLYQLITGVLPFDADTSMGIVLKHINEPPPSPRAIRPDLPLSLEQISMRALTKDPNQRYQSAAQLAEDLRRVAAGEELEAWQPDMTPTLDQTIPMQATPQPASSTPPPWPTPTPTPLPTPRRKRRRVLLTVAIAIVTIVLTGVGLLAYSNQLGDVLSRVGLPPLPQTPGSDQAATQLAATLEAMQATIGAPTIAPSPTPPPTPTTTSSPTPDLTAIAMATCRLDMTVISDRAVWPAVLSPGQEFVKRWRVKNTGNCEWPWGVELIFASGDELDIVQVDEITSLPPESTTEIEVTFEAPADYGTYASAWQLQDSDGNAIGEPLEIGCRVGPTPTPRPVATATPTATATPSFTPTPAEPLRMSYPALISCKGSGSEAHGGKIGWNAWGGTEEYHYYFSTVSPNSELDAPYNEFNGFPHVATYFTTSGDEVVSETVYYTKDSCPD